MFGPLPSGVWQQPELPESEDCCPSQALLPEGLAQVTGLRTLKLYSFREARSSPDTS